MALFTIFQTEQGIILRLGKVEQKDGQAYILQPGLHAKIPLIETVKLFDMRIQTLDIQSSRVITSEQKDVTVDAFVKWRVKNIVPFFTATGGSYLQANSLLEAKINGGMRATIGKHTIQELLSVKRIEVMKEILQQARVSGKSLGIEVVDVRIKRVDLPAEVSKRIFERMRSAREKTAASIRADGHFQAEKIKARAEKQAVVIVADAKSKALKTRAEGDANAATIYAQSYDQNPEFYDFMQSLNVYQQVFKKNNATMVLSPQGALFKYFNPGDQSKKGA